METALKIAKLQRVLSNAEQHRDKGERDAAFEVWRTSTLRTLSAIFGDDSMEFHQFRRLPFYVMGMPYEKETDLKRVEEIREAFQRDLYIATEAIKEYLDEATEQDEHALKGTLTNTPMSVADTVKPIKVFIGHGRSKLYTQLQIHLQQDHGLEVITFESESRTSETVVNILEEFLEESTFAVIIMTAEDETAGGAMRARQNVIHEVGLFQGKLGFKNVVILKQKGIEEFTNISGLQYIEFSEDNIDQTFHYLTRTLKKSGIIS